MKLVLTGATGFIGSHLARHMAAEGCEVHALVRPGSDTWRIRDLLPRLHVVECDLGSAADVDCSLAAIRPDHCVHLAWCTEPGAYWTSLDNVRFLGASLHLAARLAEIGCQRLVVAGTCAEYEPVDGAVSERDRTGSHNLYVASKQGLRLTLEQLAESTGMQVAWGRVFYLYGPFEDERRLVPTVIRSLLRDAPIPLAAGDHVRDFSHVEDVAAAIWAITRSGLVGPVNIGSGRPVVVREVAATLARILERPLRLEPAVPIDGAHQPPPRVYADTSRLRSETTWAPKFSLEQGLRQTAEWWTARLGECA